ncbi:MAG: hypothetical protein LBC97_09455 [Bifidobacteriaceae bacterium]|jgi:hypothetical protein|nr:hypothetical protein [Bifidobacteriaceae bacterium]
MIILNEGATVYAPNLTRTSGRTRPKWGLPGGQRLAVSLLLHAPRYRDPLPPAAVGPQSMQGGVGRDTAEPRSGQVARVSQWDFGLTTGLWRLLDAARDVGFPAAVALDADGVTGIPGLAALAAERADEVVVRGRAANVLLHSGMTAADEAAYIEESRRIVEAGTGKVASGWFSPERASTPNTARALAAAGFRWFGDWPMDEVPVRLGQDAADLTAVPFGVDTEDMFALYSRGLPFGNYRDLLQATVDRLVAEAQVVGARFLGLSWFGWVLGQACFADVASDFLAGLTGRSDILPVLPSEAAALAAPLP